MYSDLDISVVAADLDPQANLTAAFMSESQLEYFYEKHQNGTIFGCIEPMKRRLGDISEPYPERVSENLTLIAGDIKLSSFEDDLSDCWPKSLGGDEGSFRILSAFYRAMQRVAKTKDAKIVLIDLGPNLGAINRAALISSDYVVIPLSPDLFSLKGLENLGPALQTWRKDWGERLGKNLVADLELPSGSIKPLGYIVLQHSIRLDRPVKAYEKWIARIPGTYAENVLGEPVSRNVTIDNDPQCLALIKHYRSLMPMAQEAVKPIFHLKPADGAIGGHMSAVNECYQDFERLARAILDRADIHLSP
jgi:cellulose biosynthesis protein BcsQ